MTEQWQELKETITEMRDNGGTGTQQEVCRFLVNLMETLEKQMQEPCEDCISRQAVLDYIDKMPSVLTSDGRRMVRRRALEEYISDTLPSVYPERSKGKWTRDLRMWFTRFSCSNCGKFCDFDYLYCPNCGAEMSGGEEDV